MQEVFSGDCVRFGVFELDLRSGELRKAGSRIALQEQPFRILARLVQRPGELVTREELREELWPADTFVDFDHGLNAAIKRLRDTLGDSADTPGFIETIPRRGYRFVAPVQSDAPAHQEASSNSPPPRSPATLRKWMVASVALAVVVGAPLGWGALTRPPLTHSDRIVLGEFENHTGDPVLSGTVRHAVAVTLSESRFVNLVSEDAIRETLQMMRRAPDDPLPPPVAREVCQRLGDTATLTGSIASLGSAYVVALTVTLCASGEVVAREQAEASGKEEILRALDEATRRLRRRLGEALSAIQAANTPLERATTLSFEALKAFTDGERRFVIAGQFDAIPFYKRAIELDPEFAMAHAKLSVVYGNNGMEGAEEAMERAFNLRDRLTEREQFYVTAHYQRLARADLDASRSVYELWKAAYPRDFVPSTSLGLLFVRRGEFDRALREFQEAARLSPIGHTYSNLFSMYLHLDRIAEAKSTFAEWERSSGGPTAEFAKFLLAFHERDIASLERSIEKLRDSPQEWNFNVLLPQAMAFFGRMNRARVLFATVRDARTGPGFERAAALQKLTEALWEAETGDCTRARQRVRDAWQMDRGKPVIGMTAVMLAACGDAAGAERFLGELPNVSPPNPWNVRREAVRARLDLARGDPAAALRRLEPLRHADLTGALLTELAGQAHGLAAVYLRGRAYLALGRGREAAAEFQRILDYPGVAAFAPYQALAPLCLARALALAGDARASRAAYDRFFSLWKGADPDVPVLVAARAEYARLSE